jgi:ribosomal protein L31
MRQGSRAPLTALNPRANRGRVVAVVDRSDPAARADGKALLRTRLQQHHDRGHRGARHEWETTSGLRHYPLVIVEISADSHPFWTGMQRLIDAAGQVQKFHRRYGRRTST